jgi:hypothetical protein
MTDGLDPPGISRASPADQARPVGIAVLRNRGQSRWSGSRLGYVHAYQMISSRSALSTMLKNQKGVLGLAISLALTIIFGCIPLPTSDRALCDWDADLQLGGCRSSGGLHRRSG